MAVDVSLTRNQKSNVLVTVLVSVAICLVGTLVWLIVAWPGDAAAVNTPGPKVTNINRYTEIDTSNDGNIDHYCIGSTGLWYEQQNSYTFAVEGNDPLCR